MFKIYDPKRYNCDEDPIILSQITKESWNLIKHLYPTHLRQTSKSLDPSKREEQIRKLMNDDNVDDNHWNDLVIYCRPDGLNENTDFVKTFPRDMSNNHGGKYQKYVDKIPKSSLKKFNCYLKRVENELKIAKKNKSLIKYKWSKYFPVKIDLPLETQPDIKPGEDVMIYVRIYEPYQKVHRCRYPAVRCNQEVVFLGSHTLDSLRDVVKCPNDFGLRCDISSCPFDMDILSKDIFKSGFIFIEDTFYNDTRCADNIDYSETIIKWAKNKPELGPFKKAVMETTAFHELKIRLGYPYVYQHQGDCEHIIVFSNIEICKPYDYLHSVVYPFCFSQGVRHVASCSICGQYVARWFITDSDRVPFDPALFCNSCFHSYNYSNKGKKIGNFKAYPYCCSGNVI